MRETLLNKSWVEKELVQDEHEEEEAALDSQFGVGGFYQDSDDEMNNAEPIPLDSINGT